MTTSIETSNVEKPKTVFRVRHLQALMMYLGLVLAFTMRMNISMAIVVMRDKNTKIMFFDWSLQRQSVILSSFFWGYLVLQIPSGELAKKYGGMIIIISSTMVNTVVTFILPLTAYYGGWQGVCACRVLQGLAQGCIYPAMHNLIGQWVPLEERGRLGSLIYAGAHLGTAFQFMVSGFIANYWGWEAIFYVNGTFGAIWLAFYISFGADCPQNSKIISDEERLYIQYSLGHVGESKTYETPWKKILPSVPFLAILIANCCQTWGLWSLATMIPSYFKQVLGVDIKSNGMVSALPYLALYIVCFPLGFMSDYLMEKKMLSVTSTRKLCNSIGFFGPGLGLICLAFAPVGNVAVAVAIFTISVGLNAGHISGFLLVHIDMAPNFASTMLGITNTAGTVTAIHGPLTGGVIIQDETDPAQWQTVFYLASAIYIVGNLFFIIFATSERQKWNDQPDKEIEKDAREKANCTI